MVNDLECPICREHIEAAETIPCCKQLIHKSCFNRQKDRRCPYCRHSYSNHHTCLRSITTTTSIEYTIPITVNIRSRRIVDDYTRVCIFNILKRIEEHPEECEYPDEDKEWLCGMLQIADERRLNRTEMIAINECKRRC